MEFGVGLATETSFGCLGQVGTTLEAGQPQPTGSTRGAGQPLQDASPSADLGEMLSQSATGNHWGSLPKNEERTQELVQQIQALDEGSTSYQDVVAEIVELNMHIVDNYVKKFVWGQSDLMREDCRAAGVEGLLKALDTYDPSKGAPFHVWARKYGVRKAVLKAFHNIEFPHLNGEQFELRHHVEMVIRDAGSKGDRLTNKDIADAIGVTVKRVKSLREAGQGSVPLTSPDDGSDLEIEDAAGASIEEMLITAEEHGVVDEVLREVVAKSERPDFILYILIRHLGLDGTEKASFRKIGRELGLRHETVRRHYKKAEKELRRVLKERLGP